MQIEHNKYDNYNVSHINVLDKYTGFSTNLFSCIYKELLKLKGREMIQTFFPDIRFLLCNKKLHFKNRSTSNLVKFLIKLASGFKIFWAYKFV